MEYQYHIFSPYRVCPLGAHVDHQHGLVTGFAIDKGVDLWFTVNGGGTEGQVPVPVFAVFGCSCSCSWEDGRSKNKLKLLI